MSLIRSLWLFGLLQMVSMTGHVALAMLGRNHALLLADHRRGELHLRHGHASPTWC